MVENKVKSWFKTAYALLMYTFLYLPIVVMIVFSFNSSKYKGSFEGFTLRWYEELFRDKAILSSVTTTFIVAISAAILATLIGTVTAVAISNLKPKYRAILLNFSYIPMVNPDIVIGISLLSLFVFLKLELGYITLILAHITFNIPYVIFAVLPKIKQLDKNLEEAALDLGATPSQAFRKVILPELVPGIMTGFMLSLTMSLDDFIVSFFTTGSGVSTLSIKIYSMTKRGVSPKINALSSILFVITMLIILIPQLKDWKNEKRTSTKM